MARVQVLYVELTCVLSSKSITAKSLPLAKRRTAVQRESTAAVLMSFDDEDTPRHILKNILMTGTRSPLFSQAHGAAVVCPLNGVACDGMQSP